MDTLRMNLTLAGQLARANGYSGGDRNVSAFLAELSAKVGTVLVTYETSKQSLVFMGGNFVSATEQKEKTT